MSTPLAHLGVICKAVTRRKKAIDSNILISANKRLKIKKIPPKNIQK